MSPGVYSSVHRWGLHQARPAAASGTGHLATSSVAAALGAPVHRARAWLGGVAGRGLKDVVGLWRAAGV